MLYESALKAPINIWGERGEDSRGGEQSIRCFVKIEKSFLRKRNRHLVCHEAMSGMGANRGDGEKKKNGCEMKADLFHQAYASALLAVSGV